MSYKNIIYEKQDRIARLTLNRPKVLNALSRPLLEELKAALNDAEEDKNIRVVILKGAGHAFCAGGDIEPSKGVRYYGEEIFDGLLNMWKDSKKMIVWDDNEPSEKVRIYDKGVDVINTSDEVYKILIQYRTGDLNCPHIDNTEALQVEINHIVECMQQNKPALTNGISGLNIVKVLEAAQASIKNHSKEIKL